MMSRISSVVKRHPIITFFVLACALSWWPSILYTLDLSPAHRGLRAFPRRARRAGYHPRQDWHCGITAPDGALARSSGVVRGGPLSPCGDHSCRHGAQRSAGRPGSLVGRVGRLDEPLLDVLDPAPDPRLRWHLGGAGLERLCPAPPASRPLGTLCQPDTL